VLGDGKVEEALADPDSTDLSDKMKATMRLLAKVTKDHASLTPADFEPVLAAGVSRQGVLDALMVAYAFNIITRMADALEFDVPEAGSFSAGADMLLSRGYR
jgi:alkylhydroperoxidase family enzyme